MLYFLLFIPFTVAFDYSNSVGLAPGLYCGLKTCYDGKVCFHF